MNYWVIPQHEPVDRVTETVVFCDEYSDWWDGGKNEYDQKYKNGDVAYFVRSNGDLHAWGIVIQATQSGQIEADDDEEGETAPWYVHYSASVTVQPRVAFGGPITIAPSAKPRTLTVDEAQAINLAIREKCEPRVIALEYVTPEFIQKLTHNPDEMRFLHWRDFEFLLAGLLDQFGYQVDVQRGTKDGGIDLFALSKADHPLGPHKYLLQAKRWKNAVGVAPVRELKFLHDHYSMTKSCLATTSRFTSGAWHLAQQYSHQLDLRDFEGLSEWIKTAWNIDPFAQPS